MTVGSLFAGIGGFDLGFERAGFEIKWQVEIDEYCRRVLERRFPNTARFNDIRDCCGNKLRISHADLRCCECGRQNYLCWADVITGGFPCQDVSGNGQRAGIDGERSGLWAEMHRIICEIRPRFVVVENVAGLFNRGIERVLGDLACIGYDCEWHSVCAAQTGLPHIRERIWIIAYPQSKRMDARIAQECRVEAKFAMPPSDVRVADWREAYPLLRGMDNGIPNQAHRGRALGNAIVPQIAQWIAERIKQVI